MRVSGVAVNICVGAAVSVGTSTVAVTAASACPVFDDPDCVSCVSCAAVPEQAVTSIPSRIAHPNAFIGIFFFITIIPADILP
jgi:hypothetical protein